MSNLAEQAIHFDDKDITEMSDKIKDLMTKDRVHTCEVLGISDSELSRKLLDERGIKILQLARLLIEKKVDVYDTTTHVVVKKNRYRHMCEELEAFYAQEAEK